MHCARPIKSCLRLLAHSYPSLLLVLHVLPSLPVRCVEGVKSSHVCVWKQVGDIALGHLSTLDKQTQLLNPCCPCTQGSYNVTSLCIGCFPMQVLCSQGASKEMMSTTAPHFHPLVSALVEHAGVAALHLVQPHLAPSLAAVCWLLVSKGVS